MKSAVFALLLVVAGAFAFPQFDNQRPGVEDRIKNVIERISKRIRDGGYDPLIIESAEFKYVVAPQVIELVATLNEFEFTGASKIDINNLQWIPYINRLIFDISLPQLKVTLGNAGVDIIVFQHTLDAQLSGSLSIRGIRIAGEININISIVGGVTVRSITIDFFSGIYESKLNLDVNGKNYSEQLNRVVGEIFPAIMDDNRNEINRGLEIIIRVLIDNCYNKFLIKL